MYWKSIDLQTQKAWKESTLIEKESSADLGRRLINGGRIPGLASVESWKPVGVSLRGVSAEPMSHRRRLVPD